MTACVCYVIDDNYLFPTLISAIQACQNVDKNQTDIIIFCVSDTPIYSIKVSSIAAIYGVRLIVVPTKIIDGMHPMFGRLFIHRMLPKHYDRILYIDGDTQIKGSLKSLIETKIERGKFLAVRDPDIMFASLSEKRLRKLINFRRSLGIEKYTEYFNSGVLVFDSHDWPSLSEKALSAAKYGGLKLDFPDQDALNISVGCNCIYIPNKWNFPGFLINSQMEKIVAPTIYHFMSNPRPWTHSVQPWGSLWTIPYRKMIESHSELANHAPKTKKIVQAKYWLQQHLKLFLEYGQVGYMHELDADLHP